MLEHISSPAEDIEANINYINASYIDVKFFLIF